MTTKTAGGIWVNRLDMATKSNASISQRIGVRGLAIFSGVVREEYLTDLRSWTQASRVYQEMADDAVVGTLLEAIRTPLLAADFDVTAVSDSAADTAAKEFLQENMDGMVDQTWRSHVNDALDFLTFGFAVAEATLEKRKDGRLWIKNLDPRGQETLHKWEWEDDQVVAMVQRDPTSGALYHIPIAKTVHMTFRGRKGNPQGKPLLRSLFRPWLKLKYMENFEAIGIERDVGGMAMISFPDPEKWSGPKDLDQLKTMFEDAFKNLRMDENMWLLVPPGARATSWGSGARSYDVRKTIEAKQKEILLRFFAQFLMLDHAGLDASGLLKGSQDFFHLGLKSIQSELLEAWNQQLVPLLFEFNPMSGVSELPKITWNDPGSTDVVGLVAAYGQATEARLITPTRSDEEHVRILMDLPELPEGEGEGPRDPAPPIMPGGGPFVSDDRGWQITKYEQRPAGVRFAEHRQDQTGVMIALYPDSVAAAKIAVPEGVSANELHLTLAFFGDEADQPPTIKEDLTRAVQAAGSIEGLSGQIGGIGYFASGDNGQPVVALIDAPGLVAYRQKLMGKLKAVGLTPSQEHDFTPHMTLKYSDPGQLLEGAENVVGTPISFDSVTVSIGRDRTEFEQHPAGQGLRTRPDKWDAFLNGYQRELVQTYDGWLSTTQKVLARAKTDGVPVSHLRTILNARIGDLEVDLKVLGDARIFEAGMRGLGDTFAHRAESPGVRTTIARLQARNEAFIVDSLIPSVRTSLTGALGEADVGALRKALTTAGGPLRSRVAGYAGGATVAIFETQKRAGTDENVERLARGEPPIAVRWVIDPAAAHCSDDPARGTFGCPGLAREYPDGFDSLPTVPAGQVSCLGNCRCHIEMNDGSGWRRA